MGSLTDEVLDEYYRDREIIRSYQPDQSVKYRIKHLVPDRHLDLLTVKKIKKISIQRV